jgi:regulator of protease activity HflC (stomatin/prohibitin superfamily)
MRRAERLAWIAVVGLVVIGAMLIGGAFAYRVTSFWAGAILVFGQALVVGMGAWGLGLARQAEELRREGKSIARGSAVERSQADQGAGGGFRMSVGDDSESTRPTGNEARDAGRILDVSLQRMLVGATGVVMAGLAGVMGWAIYAIYQWSQLHPDVAVPIVGALAEAAKKAERGEPLPAMNELCLLVGLASAAAYASLFWLTRPTGETEGYGEATSSSFTLGLTGMIALGVATLLGYFKVAGAGEVAAGIVAALLALQGLELLANAFRSYSGIEELDQEAVDLQTLPLVPMLTSVWLVGLRILFAQSMGLSEGGPKGERGVVARMMPRTLLAMVLLAIGASCLKVVKPGHVAVLERLGYTPLDADGRRPQARAILQPGLHVTMPWPIDDLVDIPTGQLQMVEVGTELHATGAWKNVDFQFWVYRPGKSEEEEAEDLFITGDPGSPQFLETYVQVEWKVADAARFYAAMSHSEFLEKGPKESKTLPNYQAMVQQCTSYAVTQTFAIHSLEQILITDRKEAEEHCRAILQEKLDALCALPGEKSGVSTRGVEIAYLSIKDLHPPKWREDRPVARGTRIGGQLVKDAKGQYIVEDTPEHTGMMERGPASAFELVVSMREFKEEIINRAQAEAIEMTNLADGEAKSVEALAKAYKAETLARAQGGAKRLTAMTKEWTMSKEQMDRLKLQLFYEALKDLLEPVTKVVVDPEAKDVHIYQGTEKGGGGFRPPGP